MDRRTFLGVVAGSFVAAPIVAGAQPAKSAARVAFLGNGSTQLSGPSFDAFRSGLRALGYVEGQSILIESRFADGKPERIDGLVPELLALAPDVVVAAGPQSLRTFKQATTSVPIVMAIISDPVEEGGPPESLARRGPVGSDRWRRLRLSARRNGGPGASTSASDPRGPGADGSRERVQAGDDGAGRGAARAGVPVPQREPADRGRVGRPTTPPGNLRVAGLRGDRRADVLRPELSRHVPSCKTAKALRADGPNPSCSERTG
jgi:hypothetical protein